MAVEKTEREIGTLISEIGRGEIKLPEIQRGYVWKPTQVARLVESLYRGYPTRSLLFWKTTETPLSRGFDLTGTPPQPVVQPLFLLDGQQRLTALSRAFGSEQGTGQRRSENGAYPSAHAGRQQDAAITGWQFERRSQE